MGGMSIGERVRVVQTFSPPLEAPPPKKTKHTQSFPWPRCAPDDPATPLGIDINEKIQDITRIVHKFFRVADVSMEELMQEVFVAIIHKNYTKSAHDPRKSSFSHYVYMIANNVCINLVTRQKRHEKERESLDAPSGADDSRTLLDVMDETASPWLCSMSDAASSDSMYYIEDVMRRQGQRDLARYVRAVRSGASPDVIREALSWDNHRMSNKTIRDFRIKIKMTLETVQD